MSATTQPELTESFEEFFSEYYHQELLELAKEASDGQPQTLTIDYMDLYKFDPDLAVDITDNPDQLLEHANKAARQYDVPVPSLGDVNVRIDYHPEERSVASTRATDIGNLLGVYAQVGYITDVKYLLEEAAFECQRCGTITRIPQTGDDFQQPNECQGCERRGPFTIDREQSTRVDFQKIQLKQPAEETAGGGGSSIELRLREDLVSGHDDDRLQAGNKVHVSGTLWDEYSDSPIGEEYLEGQHINVLESDFDTLTISDEDEQTIKEIAAAEHGDPYDLLIESIAPDHWGDERIKLALVLQMCRGVEGRTPDGSHQRGDIHLLFLGDPGTGKSSLMRRVAEVAPRSQYASGKGTSAAGLIGAAVPSEFGDEKWDIEAGALVLANQGVAAIDEIDKMDEETSSAMHDALESPQLAEIDKADIHTSLPARTSLAAAGNPKYGRFDQYEPLGQQLDLPPALLSRFDLMFMLSDQPDEEEDAELAKMITRRKRSATIHTHDDTAADDAEESNAPIATELLRKYFAYARQEVFPRTEPEIDEYIAAQYTKLRSAAYDSDDDNPVPVSARKVEAIQRLAEASARVELRERITKEDVDRALGLIRKCLQDVGMNDDDQFDVDMVEASTSKSQRDRIHTIQDEIKALATEYDEGAPIDTLLQRLLDDHQIPSQIAEREIEKLKRKGDVYQPHPDHLRLS